MRYIFVKICTWAITYIFYSLRRYFELAIHKSGVSMGRILQEQQIRTWITVLPKPGRTPRRVFTFSYSTYLSTFAWTSLNTILAMTCIFCWVGGICKNNGVGVIFPGYKSRTWSRMFIIRREW